MQAAALRFVCCDVLNSGVDLFFYWPHPEGWQLSGSDTGALRYGRPCETFGREPQRWRSRDDPACLPVATKRVFWPSGWMEPHPAAFWLPPPVACSSPAALTAGENRYSKPACVQACDGIAISAHTREKWTRWSGLQPCCW